MFSMKKKIYILIDSILIILAICGIAFGDIVSDLQTTADITQLQPDLNGLIDTLLWVVLILTGAGIVINIIEDLG